MSRSREGEPEGKSPSTCDWPSDHAAPGCRRVAPPPDLSMRIALSESARAPTGGASPGGVRREYCVSGGSRGRGLESAYPFP